MSVKICVIGAGAAGLSSGNRLCMANVFDVSVIEAMERIGGRVFTTYLEENENDTYRVEMGAQWIHGTKNNPIFDIAKSNELFHPVSSDQSVGMSGRNDRWHIFEDGSHVSKDIIRETKSHFKVFNNESDEYYRRKPLPKGFTEASSLQDYIEKRFEDLWKKNGYNDQEKQIRRRVLSTLLNFECSYNGCDSLADVSLQQCGSYVELSGSHLEIPQGYSKVLEAIAKGIPNESILLNTPVVSIEYPVEACDTMPNISECAVTNTNGMKHNFHNETCNSRDDLSMDQRPNTENENADSEHKMSYKVKLTYADGSKHYFDHVIFTGSLAFLKENQQKIFTPQLPLKKQDAIKRLGIATVDKIFLYFENFEFLPSTLRTFQPYWNLPNCKFSTESSVPHSRKFCDKMGELCCSDASPTVAEWTKKIPYILVIDTPQCNKLAMWVPGREADVMESLSDAQVMQDLRGMLQQLLPDVTVPQPTKCVRTSWGSNPYTRGSYSYIAVGSTTEDTRALAEPICHPSSDKPLVLFAGEATDPEYYSTVHGAYLSGQRAAQTIIDYYGEKRKGQDSSN